MSDAVQAGRWGVWQVPVAVLAAALLFNLGQGCLRPTLPLYLQQVFVANYQMVTLIPLVFGVGKWVAVCDWLFVAPPRTRRLMVGGLLVIAICDVASVDDSTTAFSWGPCLAGVGWAMFGPSLPPRWSTSQLASAVAGPSVCS